MSRIKNNIIFTSFISFLVIFLFFSCKVGQEKPIVENKAFLSIIVDRVDYNNDFARTILPSSDVSDFTDFELSMTRSDGLTNSYSFADYEVLVSSTIGIETGEWSFTLSSGEFSSSISQTIESGENNLSFRLDYVGSQNTGNISVSLSFPNNERVKLVKGGLLNITSEREIQGYEMEAMELIENESSMSVLYSKQNVPAGYYFIKWNIYGDLDAKVLLESKKELVLIDGGITSSDAIEMEDFLNLYDITYNLEDGSFEESFVPPCSFSKISDFDLPKASNLIKDGQFFEGWYTSPDYEGNRIDFIKAGTSGNLNLYAKWKDIDVRTVESSSSSCSLDNCEIVTLNSSEYKEEIWFFKPGYNYFGIWMDYNTVNEAVLSDHGYTPIDAQLKIYTEDDVLINEIDDENSFNFTVTEEGYYKIVTNNVSEIDGSCAYYLYKEEVSYSIRYELNGGNFVNYTGAVVSYNTSNEICLPENIYVTRPYCIFTGWYETSECNTEPIKRIPVGSYGDKVFYAGWEGLIFEVHYELDGGTNSEENPDYYTVLDSIRLRNPEKPGYTFLNWTTEVSGHNQEVTSIEGFAQDVLTLTANWQLTTYTITYVLNGGTNNSANPISYTINSDTIPLLSPRRSGYIFMGWYTSETTGITEIDPASSLCNLVLNADWEEIDNEDGIVYFEGGTVVGSNDYNVYTTGAFTEDRTVTFNSFYISDHEVTQDEYQTIMGVNPSSFNSNPAENEEQANRPVERVSWYDAIYYCNERSITEGFTPCYSVNGESDPDNWNYTPHRGFNIEGAIDCNFNVNGYRLPTSDEWEFAARGGMDKYGTEDFAFCFAGAPGATDYSQTENSALDYVGWYENISDGKTHEVKKKRAIGSLFDMSGNVWEWCWDENPGPVPCRKLRGGSYLNNPIYCSVAFISNEIAADRFSSVGLRVVRSFVLGQTENRYTISYETERGEIPFCIRKNEGASLSSLNLPELSADGYDFDGWYTDSSFSEESKVESGYTVTSNTTLYGKWSIISYSITYETNGGVNNELNPESYTIETDEITLLEPSRTDCDFRGWYTTENFTSSSKVETIPCGSCGDITLYAKWVGNFTVSYLSPYGQTPQSCIIEEGEALSSENLPELYEIGWNFEGWYLDSSRTQPASVGYELNDSILLYAKWSASNGWAMTGHGNYQFVKNGNTWTSNNHAHSSSATTTWAVIIPSPIQYTIRYTVSSEGNYDYLTLVLDGTSIVHTSGSNSSSYTTTLSVGTHTLTATYSKDGSTSSGSDQGTITLEEINY